MRCRPIRPLCRPILPWGRFQMAVRLRKFRLGKQLVVVLREPVGSFVWGRCRVGRLPVPGRRRCPLIKTLSVLGLWLPVGPFLVTWWFTVKLLTLRKLRRCLLLLTLRRVILGPLTLIRFRVSPLKFTRQRTSTWSNTPLFLGAVIEGRLWRKIRGLLSGVSGMRDCLMIPLNCRRVPCWRANKCYLLKLPYSLKIRFHFILLRLFLLTLQLVFLIGVTLPELPLTVRARVL